MSYDEMDGVLDIEHATREREKAMARVDAAADPAWKLEARAAVLSVAETLADFTIDDIWATGLRQPRESRAMGPVLRALAREGRIEPTGEFRRTAMRTRHRDVVIVWRKKVTP